MTQSKNSDSGMSVRGALQVLADVRDDATVIVTNQGSSRVWPLLTKHPRDFHYNPSTMGGAIPLGLGLALASPSMQIVVITGDGAMAMSLGSLISVAATGCQNMTVIVLDNGIYEVTGGQRLATVAAKVDYKHLAESLGFTATFQFHDEAQWRTEAQAILRSAGPRFVALRVQRTLPGDLSTPAESMPTQIARLTAEFQR